MSHSQFANAVDQDFVDEFLDEYDDKYDRGLQEGDVELVEDDLEEIYRVPNDFNPHDNRRYAKYLTEARYYSNAPYRLYINPDDGRHFLKIHDFWFRVFLIEENLDLEVVYMTRIEYMTFAPEHRHSIGNRHYAVDGDSGKRVRILFED